MSKKQQTIDLLQRDIIKLHKELVDKVSEIEELKFIVKILTDQLTDCRAKLEAKESGVSNHFITPILRVYSTARFFETKIE